MRYFARDGCVDHTDSVVGVYVGGSLIGTFTGEQHVERDLLIAVVCREPRVRLNRVAEAFGVDAKTIYRIRRKHERGGIQAIARSHRHGRPQRQTPQLEERLFALFDAGATISKAREQIGRQASRSVVARTRKKWAELRQSHKDDEALVSTTAALPHGVDGTPAPQAEAEPESSRRSGTQLDGGDDDAEAASDELEVEEAQGPQVELEAEPSTGGTQLDDGDDDDAEAASDELEVEEACAIGAKGGRRVQHLGAWTMLAMLNALGLYALAEQLRTKAESKARSAGEEFVGRVTLRAALDSVAVALSIGKRCAEGVRWLATPSGPTLLRRERVMSASWVRRV
ncbi:MAG: hypothetical protein AAB075_01960, partial [Gemmatimonadota bacterium]